MPWPLVSRFRSTQAGLPVAALSAKTVRGVVPYTRPSATATPSGPGPPSSGVLTWYSHRSPPVARSSAQTFACMSWM